MSAVAGKTYWLVGASEGLGRALAKTMADQGARLCLSARSEERLASLAGELATEAVVAPLDLRDAESVQAAFKALPEIDGIIYCAGAYDPLSAKDWDAEAVERMFDVNLTGAARALGACMPSLTARGGGHIVLIGSLAGLMGLPKSIGYSASKAGIIHLAECLRLDLPKPDFKVQVINPGFIKTRLTDKNAFKMPFLMSAEDAAERTLKAMEGDRFRNYYPRRFAAFFRVGRMLPDWLYFSLASRSA